MTNVTLELSQNNLQMRIIGFTGMLERIETAFTTSPTARLRLEHIYTLEEQAHVAIAIGVVIIEHESSGITNLTLEDTANVIGKDERPVEFPPLVRFLTKWPVFQLGVVGASRSLILHNSALRKYGADHIGFKHVVEFGTYSDFLDHENLKKPIIEFFLNVRIPDEENAMAFDCASIENSMVRKVCGKALGMAKVKVDYHLHENRWKPHIMAELQIGYGENPVSQAYNTLVHGIMLSFFTYDIPIATNILMTEAAFGIRFAPLGLSRLGFELKGKIQMELFSEVFMFKAKVLFSIGGKMALKLWQKGTTGLLFILPIWVGNLKAQAKLYKGVVALGGMVGGEVNVGWKPKNGVDTRLKGMGMVSIDDFKGFIYLKLSPITIQSLLNMFVGHGRWTLPSFIGSSGIRGLKHRQGPTWRKLQWLNRNKDAVHVLHPEEFAENPEQFLIVFSPFSLQVDHVRGLDNAPIIQPGLTVIGQTSMLGVHGNVYVRIDPMHLSVELDISLEPLYLGNGLVKLTVADIQPERHNLDFMQTAGPNVYTSFQLIPSRDETALNPEFRISAALEVFGVRIAIDVGLSLSGFHVKAELNIWDWFVAKCIIEVKSTKAVRVYGEVTLHSLSDLAHGFFRNVIQKLKFWKWKSDKSTTIVDRDAEKVRRRLGMSKFIKGLKKIVRPITRVKLLSVKFDLNNIAGDKIIPVQVEFQVALLGIHLIKVKSKKRQLSFDKPLDETEQDAFVLETIETLHDCVGHCDVDEAQCLERVQICQKLLI